MNSTQKVLVSDTISGSYPSEGTILNTHNTPSNGLRKALFTTVALQQLVSFPSYGGENLPTMGIKTIQFSQSMSSPAIEQPLFEPSCAVREFVNTIPCSEVVLENLNDLIANTFGNVKIHFEVLEDREEGWKTLGILIKSSENFDSLMRKEEKLFDKIAKDESLSSALEYVTISYL